MTTYRVAPTVAVGVAFFIVANSVLLLLLGGPAPAAGEAEHEAWLVYYALRYADELPETIDRETLRVLFAELDPDAVGVLDHLEFVSFSRDGRRYQLVLRDENGRTHLVTHAGATVGG